VDNNHFKLKCGGGNFFVVAVIISCYSQHCPLFRKDGVWGTSWLYGSWIYEYVCNRCLSTL